MPLYLDESQFGTATDVIGFPHLLICMGVVAMTPHALFGVHLDERTDTGVLCQELASFMAQRNVHGNDVLILYGSCNHKVRYKDLGNQAHAWKLEMKEVAAAAIGYQGAVRGFDTSIIAPRNGTYVEYVPKIGSQRCRIYYKRDEKMTYNRTVHGGGGGGNPNAKRYRGRVLDLNIETTSVTMHNTFLNRGRLHEVDYHTRLHSFLT